MKVLSSQEIMHISGGFSATSFVTASTVGAVFGAAFGGTVASAAVGAAIFGSFNLLYQAAVSLDQMYYCDPCYDYDYYYVY